MKQKRCA